MNVLERRLSTPTEGRSFPMGSTLVEGGANFSLFSRSADRIELTRKGLLHADALLPAFFEPEHRGVRYT